MSLKFQNTQLLGNKNYQLWFFMSMRCWGGTVGSREGNHYSAFGTRSWVEASFATMSSLSWEKEAGVLYFWWGTEKVQLIQQLWCPQQAKHHGAGGCRETTSFKLNFCRAADGTAKTGLRALPRYKQALLR